MNRFLIAIVYTYGEKKHEIFQDFSINIVKVLNFYVNSCIMFIYITDFE